MSRWKWALLIFELALFAIILILPQVALPDFTFHRGTAPVAAKSALSITLDMAAHYFRAPLPVHTFLAQPETHTIATLQGLDSRLSLFCTLIC
jgi:hypothetical protein